MASSDLPVVAVLGTGTMGLPMARNIARAGMEVRAWNRTREHAAPLAGDGVRVVDEPSGAVDGADIVVTMLSDAGAVLDVAERLFAGWSGASAVWLQTSTIGIAAIERCAELAPAGVALVDAPLSGTRAPAEQGKLVALVGGPPDALARCAPVLDATCAKVVRAGDEVGAGTRLKLVVNHWLLAVMESIAETIQAAEAFGVDPRLWLETIAGGPLDLPYAQLKGSAILDRSLGPAFKLDLALKDALLVLEAAEAAGVKLPLLDVVADRQRIASERGHGDEDMAAVYFGG